MTNLAAKHRLSLGVAWRGPTYTSSFSASWTDRAFFADVLDERFWGYTDPYWMLSGSLGIKVWRDNFELRFAGTNLLDKAIKEHVFGDIIRRKFTAEMRWKF